MNNKKIKENILPIVKLIGVTTLSVLFFVGIYFLLKKTGVIGTFNNIEELKVLILSTGFWCYAIYAFLQFLQVTILPLPAMVTTIVGVIIFGPFVAFLLSTLAIVLGSVFAFILGKLFGEKLLYWSIGKEKTLYFQNKLKKGKFIFFIMMLFPLFPDDILCMLAGVINLDFKFFLITNLITRPIGLFCLCFLSSGSIIPFNSKGFIFLSIIAIVLVIAFIVVMKNKTKIETFVNVKILKNK